MSREYKKVLFLFRRDLRVYDNTGLLHAHHDSKEVYPLFIFDPRQIADHPYRSVPGLSFMLESLGELDTEIQEQGGRLHFYQGEAEDVLSDLLERESIDALYLNGDYTPFSKARDKKIEQVCEKLGVAFHCFHDSLLQPPGTVHKDDGNPYTVYTPFYKKASQKEVRTPRDLKTPHWAIFDSEVELEAIKSKYLGEGSPEYFRRGGRSEAIGLLENIAALDRYDDTRDIPSEAGTTGLSPHHKFGTVSAREVYHKVAEVFSEDHTLIRELYWRDFFTHIGFHFPHVYGKSFRPKYDDISWPGTEEHFQLWCEGRTGFPIVDAGMRELNATGFMHNRVRMITASFLVKDLHVDWRKGEQYFARQLLDYDPAVNNGNWQWAASTGCDAQPYFRIFNPWSQQKKFDKEALYIKRWIPELSELTPKEIHALDQEKTPRPQGYPEMVVDHKKARERALMLYTFQEPL